MKSNRITPLAAAVVSALISTAAVSQITSPSSIIGSPAAIQYTPYGVATPQMTGTLANGTTFDYRSDRKRVAHFWKTYAHRVVPPGLGPFPGTLVSTIANIPANWTGNLASCVVGDISAPFQETAVRQVNWYRAMIGALPVINGSAADRLVAQQAALVNLSGNSGGTFLGLTHTPTTRYPCFSTATAAAAGRSELSYFNGKTQQSFYNIDRLMDDDGPNNARVGHRQGITYPALTSVAYGEAQISVPNSTTIEGIGAMPLDVAVGTNRTTNTDRLWPNAGFIPFQTYPQLSNRWSMACSGCDFSTSTVSVLRNGSVQPVQVEPISKGFIDYPAIVWQVLGVNYFPLRLDRGGNFVQDEVFDTTITYTQNGVAKTKTYRTTVFNPEIETDFVPPFDVTDHYWVPTESGWGMKLVQATDGNVFGAVYMYDQLGEPLWVTLQGSWTAPGVFAGKLFSTRGPGYGSTPFDPKAVVSQEAGTGTLTFAPDTQAVRFDFTMGNQNGSKSMVRFSNISEAYRNGENYRGMWWNANESGWGLTIQHYYSTLFVAWFTYNPDGSPLWTTLQGSWTSDNTYEGKLYQTKQAPWNPASFNPAATQVIEAGTAKLTFTDFNRGTFDYTLKGVTGRKLVEKFEF